MPLRYKTKQNKIRPTFKIRLRCFLTIYPSMRRVFPIRGALFSPLHGGMGAAHSLEGRLPTFESPYMSTVDLIFRRRFWWRGQICRDVSSMLSMQGQDKWLTNFILEKARSVTHRFAVYLFGIDRSCRFSSSPWTSAQAVCGLQRASLDLKGRQQWSS